MKNQIWIVYPRTTCNPNLWEAVSTYWQRLHPGLPRLFYYYPGLIEELDPAILAWLKAEGIPNKVV